MAQPEPSDQTAPQPPDFVRVAWGVVKRGPLPLILRLVSDFTTNVITTVAGIVILIGVFVALGSELSPASVVGLAGLVAATLGTVLALDAFVMGSIWTHGSRAVRDTPVESSMLQDFVGGFDAFGEALGIRVIHYLTRFAIVGLFVAWFLPLFTISTRTGGLLGSEFWLPAAVMAVALFVYSLFAALVVLTLEMIAPARFVGGHRLGDAILEAAKTVLDSPLFIYRVFVTALGILLPALALAWGASLLYAFTFEIESVAPLTAMLRSIANMVLFASLGLFVVMLQYSFFGVFAHRMGLLTEFPEPFLSRSGRGAERDIPLASLLPVRRRHVIDVDEVLDMVHPAIDEEE